MTKKELIISYLYNKSVRADTEYEQLRYNVRYREADESDMLEQIIQKVRKDTIDEILLEVLKIYEF